MLALFKQALAAGRAYFESAETKSTRFVTQFVEPDMLDKGFGFGRANTCKALIRLRVTNFEQLFSLTTAQLETIRTGRGIGPKVFTGFQKYLAARGVLPNADAAAAETIVSTDNTTADNQGERIDVV